MEERKNLKNKKLWQAQRFYEKNHRQLLSVMLSKFGDGAVICQPVHDQVTVQFDNGFKLCYQNGLVDKRFRGVNMCTKTYEKLKDDAMRYGADQLQAFIDEIGWESWMDEFTEPNGDITERGLSEIDTVLAKAFNEAHGIK